MTTDPNADPKFLAGLVVDALVDAQLIPKDQFHRAADIAAEEILVRQCMGDYWCTLCPQSLPKPASITLSLPLACPFPRAYTFLSNPQSFPQWASGLSPSPLTPTADPHTFLAQTPAGPARIRFTPPNPFGVLDHYVLPENAPAEIHIPMRLLQSNDACEITLTLRRQPEMTDAQFAADADWVRRDLAALKSLLESDQT